MSSSFAETKTPTTPSITTTLINPTFYRASFARPPSISLDLFNGSTKAMEEGKERNPFVHWEINRYHIPQDPCKCEYSKKFDLSKCIDCRQQSILQPQIAKVQKQKNIAIILD